MVEHFVANENVVSSNLIARSKSMKELQMKTLVIYYNTPEQKKQILDDNKLLLYDVIWVKTSDENPSIVSL